MIEVEKKFKLSEVQKAELLANADYVSRKVITDRYYDYPDWRMSTKHTWLRFRNGKLDYKDVLPKSGFGAQSLEIDEPEAIFAELGIEYDSNQDVDKQLLDAGLEPLFTCVTDRTTYRKGEFQVDVDSATFPDQPNFRYEVVEIELTSDDKHSAKELSEKIKRLAVDHGFGLGSVQGKVIVYMQRFRPDHYALMEKDTR